jgi:hypothetical protein
VIPTMTIVGTILATLAAVIYTIRSQLRRNMMYIFRRKPRFDGAVVSVTAGADGGILSSTSNSNALLNACAQESQESLQPQQQQLRLSSLADNSNHSSTRSTYSNFMLHRGSGSRHSRQTTHESSSRQDMLNQAIIHCFAYGIVNLFCMSWTVAVRIFTILDWDTDLLTTHYWVCNECLLSS